MQCNKLKKQVHLKIEKSNMLSIGPKEGWIGPIQTNIAVLKFTQQFK